jgi:hypothetical protein
MKDTSINVPLYYYDVNFGCIKLASDKNFNFQLIDKFSILLKEEAWEVGVLEDSEIKSGGRSM